MFTITGPSNIQLLKFWLFNFSSFQANFVQNFMEKVPGFKTDFEVLIKFYCFTNIYDLKFLDNETTVLWFFFIWNFHGSAFCFLNFVIWGNIKTSILLIILKCIVVGYSNGNKSFTGRLFSNYGLLNMLFHFFWYLIDRVFHETFVKRFMKKLSFFSSNFKNQLKI